MKAAVDVESFRNETLLFFTSHQTQRVDQPQVRFRPAIADNWKLEEECEQRLKNGQYLNESENDKERFVSSNDHNLPEEHEDDQEGNDDELWDWKHDEGVEQVHAVGNREAEHVLSAEVRVMQLDLSLIVQTRQYGQSLTRLFSLIAQNNDHDWAEHYLQNVYGQSYARLVSEDAQKLPHIGALIELGRVSVVFDNHDQLENEQGNRDNEHEAAEEPLELDVCLIVAQHQWQDPKEHCDHIDQRG